MQLSFCLAVFILSDWSIPNAYYRACYTRYDPDPNPDPVGSNLFVVTQICNQIFKSGSAAPDLDPEKNRPDPQHWFALCLASILPYLGSFTTVKKIAVNYCTRRL